MTPDDLSAQKAALRARAKKTRRSAATKTGNAAAEAARLFLESFPADDGLTIALYSTIGDEFDTAPLAAALFDAGARLALPVMAGADAPLIFRAWTRDAPLRAGAHEILEPEDSAPAAAPDIIVVPLLAFDRTGARLGYGGGYYDRTLGALRQSRRIAAVGLGYAAQEVDAVPAGPLDQRLDWIITERDIIRANPRPAG